MQVDFETRGVDGSPAIAFATRAREAKALEMNTFQDPAVQEFKPKKQPSVHRSLHVDGAITEQVVEHVLDSVPKGAPSAMVREVLAERLGYAWADLDVRVRRRIERWKQNREPRGHRMPTHLKVAATSIALIDAVHAEVEKRAAEPISAKVGRTVKGWADKVKSAMAEASGA